MSSQTNPLPPREDSVGSSGLYLKSPSPKEFLNISAISASIPHVEHEETSSTSIVPPTPSIQRPISAFTSKYSEISTDNIIPTPSNGIFRRFSHSETSRAMKKETPSSTMANRTLKKGSSIILSTNRFDPILADCQGHSIPTALSAKATP